MTLTRLKKKAEGEPGILWHMIDVTLRQRRIECMVGIETKLHMGRSDIEELTHQNSSYTDIEFLKGTRLLQLVKEPKELGDRYASFKFMPLLRHR